jgi:glycosidase
MDMETQYVTEDHLWYRNSYQNPASKYSDFLVYNGPGNTEPESIIFNLTELRGFDGTVRKVTTVNLLGQKVLEYNQLLFSYWVDPNRDGNFDDGVDGFRLDHMMDDLDWKGKFTGLFQNFWTPLIDSLKAINPQLIFIAEQANWSSFGNEYLHEANVDRVFAFRLREAIVAWDKQKIMALADSTFSTPDPGKQIVFIENHDTDRFASMAHGDPGKLKAAAALNLLIGGIPSIYYGQEIGMRGSGGFGKFGNTDGNDIPRREAFEWYPSVSGEGMALWYRDSGPWWDQRSLKDNDGISYSEQKADSASLWNVYRDLLALRREYPVISSGKFRPVDNDNRYLCSFMLESEEETVLIVVNLAEDRQHALLSPGMSSISSLIWLMGEGRAELLAGSIRVSIAGYGFVVLRVNS